MSGLPVINGGNSTEGGSCGGGSCGSMGGSATQSSARLPKWLKRQIPKGNNVGATAKLLDELNLETVCDNAKCPNRMECYSQQTATFMILGKTCTRPCGFLRCRAWASRCFGVGRARTGGGSGSSSRIEARCDYLGNS